jgi:formylglycine-generating enzyme required for sulfatase activity
MEYSVSPPPIPYYRALMDLREFERTQEAVRVQFQEAQQLLTQINHLLKENQQNSYPPLAAWYHQALQQINHALVALQTPAIQQAIQVMQALVQSYEQSAHLGSEKIGYLLHKVYDTPALQAWQREARDRHDRGEPVATLPMLVEYQHSLVQDLQQQLNQFKVLERSLSGNLLSDLQREWQHLKAQANQRRIQEQRRHDLLTPAPPIRQENTRLHQLMGDFVAIQPGHFYMGEGSGARIEQIETPFLMQSTPVTQGLWQAIMNKNPSHFQDQPDCPVEQVSWHDCQRFIARLNRMSIGHYRLPTEAEWEYCCRAGSQSAFYFGDDEADLDDYAWYEHNSDGHTHPVGQKKPNAWGLYDMHGNVWEWCQDGMGEERIYRGGSWCYFGRYCRSSSRFSITAGLRHAKLGLRLVKCLS